MLEARTTQPVHAATQKRRYVFVALLAAAGIALSVFAFIVVLGFERDRHQQEFDSRSAGRIGALQTEINAHVAVLHSLDSFYSASGSVNRQQFGEFAKNELESYPTPRAIQALEWIPLVTSDERAEFESAVQAEGFAGFAINEQQPDGPLVPAGERLEYFPVNYIEPFTGNEAAHGFDLASNPSRLAALNVARLSGEAVATQRISLVQEQKDQFGFLLFAPAYKKEMPLSTPQQRSDALSGFVLGVFRVDDMVHGAWASSRLLPLAADDGFFLIDRSAPEGSQALMTLAGGGEASEIEPGQLAYTSTLSVGGRIWEARITTLKQPLLSIWQPWSALSAGLSLTIIVLAYLLLAMQRETRTQLLVEQRTRELSETNRQLGDEMLDRSRVQLEMAGLYEISRIFSAEGNFETKATEALEKLAVLASADWVTLRLPKEDAPGLHLVAAAGPAVKKFPPIPVFTEAMTMSTRAFAEGTVMVIDDYSAQPAASSRLADLGMKSMVILPVKARERTSGIITVISREKSHFNPELVALLTAVGEGLGVLLDNSLLQEETELSHLAQRRLSDEHEVMAEIGRVISSSLDMEEVFEQFAQQTRGLIPFDRLEITLISRNGEHDEVAFSTSPFATTDGTAVSTPLDGSLTGLAVSGTDGLIIQGLGPEEVRSEHPCLADSLDAGLRSWLIVPLMHRDRGIGALFIAANEESAFSQHELGLAARIGDQIASAISNSHHYQEGKKLEHDAGVLSNLGRIVNSSMDISEVYETFAEEIEKLIPFDRMSLSFANYEDGTMSPTWVIGTDVKGLREGDAFPMIRSLAGEVVRTKAPYLLEADSERNLELKFPGLIPVYKAGTVSFMAVPLVSRDVVIAVLRLGSKQRGIYTQQHLDMLQRIGDQIAGAIANADLYAQQKVAEDALREREARLRGIVESAIDGIITIDEIGTVESFNQGAELIFGYASTEVVGNNIKMLMPYPYHGQHDGYLKQFKNTGEKRIIRQGREVVGRRKDNSQFPLDLSVSAVELVGRRIYTGIVRDITESKALQQEIEQRAKELEKAYAELQTLDKMKDEFISTVSHELRTPLTSIKGAAEILLNYRDEDPATQVEFLSIIDNESDRLTRLINDVLDLSRIESGEMLWEISQVDLKGVVETAVLSTQALTVQKNVKVDVVYEKGLPSAVADPDKLIQVITNLLSNAVKFTPNGGLIRVQSRLQPGPRQPYGKRMVEISVSDNGVGILKTEFDKIFGRFQQAGTSLSDRPQGTGLGLAISKEIVTHMGGQIWVESEPGEGSTFFFTVPTGSPSSPVADPPGTPETKASQNGKSTAEYNQRSSSTTTVSS